MTSHRRRKEEPEMPFLLGIVNGEVASQRWGWMVSLVRHPNHTHFCGGSIISSSWILTAAHCFPNHNLSDVVIHAGSNNLRHSTQRRHIARILLHPYFNSDTYVNDIALIQLSIPFDMNDPNLGAVCLPSRTIAMDDGVSASEYPSVNSDIVAIGWGKTAEYMTVLSEDLQEVTLNIIPPESDSCEALRSKAQQFCATVETGDKDTCQGDSGGPLMIRSPNHQWILAGVTSAGIGCAVPGYAGVYTRVAFYTDWITSIVGSIHVPTRTLNDEPEINIGSRYSPASGHIIVVSIFLSLYFI